MEGRFPNAFVEVKVRGMEHGMLQALEDYEGKIQAAVREAVRMCFDSFDFHKEVKMQVNYLLQEELRKAIDSKLRVEAQKLFSENIESAVHEFVIKRKKGPRA